MFEDLSSLPLQLSALILVDCHLVGFVPLSPSPAHSMLSPSLPVPTLLEGPVVRSDSWLSQVLYCAILITLLLQDTLCWPLLFPGLRP